MKKFYLSLLNWPNAGEILVEETPLFGSGLRIVKIPEDPRYSSGISFKTRTGKSERHHFLGIAPDCSNVFVMDNNDRSKIKYSSFGPCTIEMV